MDDKASLKNILGLFAAHAGRDSGCLKIAWPVAVPRALSLATLCFLQRAQWRLCQAYYTCLEKPGRQLPWTASAATRVGVHFIHIRMAKPEVNKT
eukprot:6211187-Pleurochrysis_carterae.AAC.6